MSSEEVAEALSKLGEFKLLSFLPLLLAPLDDQMESQGHRHELEATLCLTRNVYLEYISSQGTVERRLKEVMGGRRLLS